ncbi:hypothetical protein GGH19_002308 [Coemansia sp. RSA 1807]|nr:hypothetical protein GGH19_002308 [Coemansia sp. RSA 1807]
MSSRLFAYSRARTVLWRRHGISATALRFTSSSSTDKPVPTQTTNHTDADPPVTEQPSVVASTPLYSKDEADAIKPSSEKANDDSSGKKSGSRFEFVREREPIVVHDASQPIKLGKWYRIDANMMDYNQVGKSHINTVPRLAHGLERVLFSPGVHLLQDPNSRVYNFDPYIRGITQPDEFDFDKLTPYITSSKDSKLIKYARERKKRFVGSTSSMTHVLSHLYFAISGGKQPDISSMSMRFADMPSRFTRGMRYPASIALRYNDGVYSIDADKSFDVKDSILSVMGKSLEKLLTSTPSEFEMYKKQNSWKVKEIPEENYHYVEAEDFILRSQLDCRDDRLPRKTFDLKTRGSLAIRMDLDNHEVSRGYQIKTMKGRMQSFEREYYDMVRSAFLKYNFQVRIGNMDGIFVAYHNTARMFGFQYISRREMDEVLYGNELTGNHMFKMILLLLSKMLRTVTDQYPETDVRVTFNSFTPDHSLSMWVEVIDDEKEAIAVKMYQETGQYSVNPAPTAATPEASKEAASKEGVDPFATKDPLGAKPTETDAENALLDELLDEDVDPVEDVYVNSDHPIQHYRMESFSTLNNQDTDDAITLRDQTDEWSINWSLKKSTAPPDELVRHYRQLRLKQSTFFERPSADTPEEELAPLVKVLRRLSRRNMWMNNTPRERVVVNKSRIPDYAPLKHHRADRPVKASSPKPRHRAVGPNLTGRLSIELLEGPDPNHLSTVSTIAENIPASGMQSLWSVPHTLKDSKNYAIKIVDEDGEEYYGQSFKATSGKADADKKTGKHVAFDKDPVAHTSKPVGSDGMKALESPALVSQAASQTPVSQEHISSASQESVVKNENKPIKSNMQASSVANSKPMRKMGESANAAAQISGRAVAAVVACAVGAIAF